MRYRKLGPKEELPVVYRWAKGEKVFPPYMYKPFDGWFEVIDDGPSPGDEPLPVQLVPTSRESRLAELKRLLYAGYIDHEDFEKPNQQILREI
jgi:hypothetical protein